MLRMDLRVSRPKDTQRGGYPAVSGSFRTPPVRYPIRKILRPVWYPAVSNSIGPFRTAPGGYPIHRILRPAWYIEYDG